MVKSEATLTVRLGAAGYFMAASTVVQLSNKVTHCEMHVHRHYLLGSSSLFSRGRSFDA